MAASRPTYLQKKTKYPYTLKNKLRTLADALGCFPFDIGPSRPKSDLPFLYLTAKIKNYNFKIHIQSFTGFKSVYKTTP